MNDCTEALIILDTPKESKIGRFDCRALRHTINLWWGSKQIKEYTKKTWNMETWFKTDPALQIHEEIKDKILASV